MIDYRLFYPHLSIRDQERPRRPLNGHRPERVYRTTTERDGARRAGQR